MSEFTELKPNDSRWRLAEWQSRSVEQQNRIAELEQQITDANRFFANESLVKENDRLREAMKSNSDHITERLQWILRACEIDRDARHELESLVKESEAQ